MGQKIFLNPTAILSGAKVSLLGHSVCSLPSDDKESHGRVTWIQCCPHVEVLKCNNMWMGKIPRTSAPHVGK